jgi:hypothetical protein
VLSKLARFFDWRSALLIVKPATLIGWHRACVPAILALEVETSRPASDIGRGAMLKSSNGGRKSNLGRRADCR